VPLVPPAQPEPGRLLLLTTSPRVAPGLLSGQAWSALRDADAVYAAGGHPLAGVLAEAGVQVEVPEVGGTALADFLTERARGARVVWLAGPDDDPDLVAAPDATTLAGSWDLPGSRLLDLVAVMDRLRSPGGCPWDAEQTHTSLLPYLLEEAYETVEAVEAGDLVGLREELGDLLLQVVFHARLAAEHPHDPWTVDEVADGVVTKLVSRHPHVFGDARTIEGTPDAAELEQSWDALKRREKGRTSAVDGIPLAQPALALAAKLIARATRAGVAVPLPEVDLGPVVEAAGSLTDESLGDLLLALVARASAQGIDAEAALRGAARRYADAVRRTEIASAP
jgi:XTP/dITP diphosphohydrolase